MISDMCTNRQGYFCKKDYVNLHITYKFGFFVSLFNTGANSLVGSYQRHIDNIGF